MAYQSLPIKKSSNSENELSPHEITQKKRRRVLLGIISIIALAAILYLAIIRQHFVFFKTSEELHQPQVTNAQDLTLISVPLNIIVLENPTGGSERSAKNVTNLVANATNIWHQAGVKLNVVATSSLIVSNDELRAFYRNIDEFLLNVHQYRSDAITVILLKSLKGINGISYDKHASIAVADYATVYDYRALAHEIGHQLGLNHIAGNTGSLMNQGANGTSLSDTEIETARKFAKHFK